MASARSTSALVFAVSVRTEPSAIAALDRAGTPAKLARVALWTMPKVPFFASGDSSSGPEGAARRRHFFRRGVSTGVSAALPHSAQLL